MTEVERFMARVSRQPNGCWLWTGILDKDGYGRFGRCEQAHRAAWRLFKGDVPALLDHYVCDARACVNPEHTRAASQRENVLRGASPAAQHATKERCPKGHAYTRRSARGRRVCQPCNTESARAYRQRKKGAMS